MKKIWIVAGILGFVGLYLYSSYRGYYNFLGEESLRAPYHPQSTIINPGIGQPRQYLALGDSLSDGVGVEDYRLSFPYQLAESLSDGQSIELVNLGMAGANSRDVVGQLSVIENLNPEIVTILVGINDIHNLKSKSEFENNYRKILASVKSKKVYAISIPYLGSKKIVQLPFNLFLNWRTKEFNSVIKKLAKESGAEYIDIYSIERGDDFYSEDLFHPSASGYKEWLKAWN